MRVGDDWLLGKIFNQGNNVDGSGYETDDEGDDPVQGEAQEESVLDAPHTVEQRAYQAALLALESALAA